MNANDEVRRLSARAMSDAQHELEVARAALVRAQCYIDKHHELALLADRLAAMLAPAQV